MGIIPIVKLWWKHNNRWNYNDKTMTARFTYIHKSQLFQKQLGYLSHNFQVPTKLFMCKKLRKRQRELLSKFNNISPTLVEWYGYMYTMYFDKILPWFVASTRYWITRKVTHILKILINKTNEKGQHLFKLMFNIWKTNVCLV